MRLRTAVTLLVLLLAAPAAAEPPAPVEPAAGASFAVGSLPWFSVTAPEGTARVAIAVTGRFEGGESGPVAGDFAERQDDGTFGWRPPSQTLLSVRPGRYFWRATAISADGALNPGPEQSFVLRPRAGATRRDAIPARLGHRLGGSFAVSAVGVPRRVSWSRFSYLARLTGRRWGLRPAGTTRARPGAVDGRNVVGFSSGLPPGAIGLTTTRLRNRYRRLMRCDASGCVEVSRRLVGTSVVDRDVELDARLAWADGPDYPWPHEMDLETVLIHELGHFAGNRGHLTSQCANSPLVTYGSEGDWWRSPTDVFRAACQRAVQARAASLRRPRPRFEHRTLVTTDLETVYRGSRGAMIR